jgi:hypothetical protein
MSNITVITLTDAESTPVDHTFNPISTYPSVFRENDDTEVPRVGESELILSVKEGKDSESINKVRVTLRIPVLEESSGAASTGYVAPPRVAYFNQAIAEFLLPGRGTPQQRLNLITMIADALTDAQVVAAVEKLEQPY